MGVMCEINLQKTSDECFKPGSAVKGAVRYAVDKDIRLDDIVIALKGYASCQWKTGNGNSRKQHTGKEELIKIKNSILSKELKEIVPVGVYTAPFEFHLLPNLPPSFRKDSPDYQAKGRIKYYISITFIPTSSFKTTKKFKKKVTIGSPLLTPVLPPGEIKYECEKKPTQLFGSNENTIKVKAVIDKSFLTPGSPAQIMLSIQNYSKINIKEVSTNLIELIGYKSDHGTDIVLEEKIRSSNSKTQPIKAGDTEDCVLTVSTKTDMHTLKTSSIIERGYCIYINTKLPLPHRDFIIRIPIEIIQSNEVNEHEDETVSVVEDGPPSYWEVMEEDLYEFKS